jgi:hypothetical protein
MAVWERGGGNRNDGFSNFLNSDDQKTLKFPSKKPFLNFSVCLKKPLDFKDLTFNIYLYLTSL